MCCLITCSGSVPLGLKVNTISPELEREPYFTDGVALLKAMGCTHKITVISNTCMFHMVFLFIPKVMLLLLTTVLVFAKDVISVNLQILKKV